jgi:multidrug efflux pump subunit AcrA (membrane-fusion protein)
MMNRKFLGIGLAAVLLAGCGEHGEEAAAPGSSTPSSAVQVAEVSVQPLWDEEEVVGNVEAAQRAVLSAKVTGVIDAVKVAPGAPVKRGDILATIDAREIKARLDSAAAAQDQAQKDFGRIERLLQSGSSTRQDRKSVV